MGLGNMAVMGWWLASWQYFEYFFMPDGSNAKNLYTVLTIFGGFLLFAFLGCSAIWLDPGPGKNLDGEEEDGSSIHWDTKYFEAYYVEYQQKLLSQKNMILQEEEQDVQVVLNSC